MPTINIPEELVPAKAFLPAVPRTPQGKYGHIVALRKTESFPLFQTDGSLNAVKVRAGLSPENAQNLMRVVLFKRKQTSPERLKGRELLRLFGLTQAEDERRSDPPYCEYNEQHCQRCPDCVYYGFAIGEEGSEKSKVYVDSAFSITGYDDSHRQFSFNALFEKGNMSQQGRMQTGFGEQDHVLPQVFFPSVVTIKDVTVNSFAYVLNNLLRNKSYGATTTRTGRVENHLVAVVFADGEIFSNLKLTQKVYDLLAERDKLVNNPLNVDDVSEAMQDAMDPLLKEDGVSVLRLLKGEELDRLRATITTVTTDQEKLGAFLKEATAETLSYYRQVIERPASRGARAAAGESGEGAPPEGGGGPTGRRGRRRSA